MNHGDAASRGEYEALVEGADPMCSRSIGAQHELSNLYANDLTGGSLNPGEGPTGEVPLGTPLTYIVGNGAGHLGDEHMGRSHLGGSHPGGGHLAGSHLAANHPSGSHTKYDHTPGNKRTHTDHKYAAYFCAYLVVLSICMLCYLYHGNYARALYGTNYNGKICGRDMKNHSYLYFPLSPKLPKKEILNKYGKCLESCPTSDGAKQMRREKDGEGANRGDNVQKREKATHVDDPPYSYSSLFAKTKPKQIADQQGNKTTNVVYSDYTKSANNNLYVEYSLLSPYYETVNIMNICFPLDKGLREKVLNVVFTDRYKVFVNLFSFANSFAYVFLFIVFSLFLCFLYVCCMYYVSSLTLHVALFLFSFSMLFFPVYFIHKHLYLLFHPIKGAFFSYHYVVSIFVCFGLLAHGVVFLFVLYLYRNTYKYTHRLITVALDFVNSVSNLLYAPCVVSAASLAWFFLWMCGYVYVMTAGTLHEQRLNLELDSNGNSEIVSLQKVFHYFRSSYLFSILWICTYFFVCEILQSLNQFTISYLGAVWYFCDKDSANYKLSAQATMKTILNYHLGSLILSSFINLCTKHLRVLFFWANSTLSLPFFYSESIYKLKERFALFLRPISNLIDIHTMAAYCEISMTSYPYLLACSTSSKKLINSTSPAASLHGITYIVNIIFPCLTTLGVTFLSFNIFNNVERYGDLFSPSFVPNPFFAALTIGVLCGMITSHFVTTLSTLTDTILYCFICECYQKQMIDENPLRTVFTPPLLKELILEIYQEYSARP
ncbi:inner membrane complex suture component, putative [Plasmodium vivax]|uniref:Choline transporter-like protein n=1 Tax=Plasmodium vivax TaxID=5855 RepID=A0A1G4H356_PLAVI|nr:inner membrane complex suture component, putative [Plasmodium vivax]